MLEGFRYDWEMHITVHQTWKKGPDLNVEALLSEAFTSNDLLLLTKVITIHN